MIERTEPGLHGPHRPAGDSPEIARSPRRKGVLAAEGELKQTAIGSRQHHPAGQLPITDPTPDFQLIVSMPSTVARQTVFPPLIPVLDRHGEFLFFADEARAQDLMRRGVAHLVRRGGRARQLVANESVSRDLFPAGRGTALDKTRYSHDHETRTNPPNVWTLTPVGPQEPYVAVPADCGGVSTVLTYRCYCGRTLAVRRRGIDKSRVPEVAGWRITRRSATCPDHAQPQPEPRIAA